MDNDLSDIQLRNRTIRRNGEIQDDGDSSFICSYDSDASDYMKWFEWDIVKPNSRRAACCKAILWYDCVKELSKCPSCRSSIVRLAKDTKITRKIKKLVNKGNESIWSGILSFFSRDFFDVWLLIICGYLYGGTFVNTFFSALCLFILLFLIPIFFVIIFIFERCSFLLTPIQKAFIGHEEIAGERVKGVNCRITYPTEKVVETTSKIGEKTSVAPIADSNSYFNFFSTHFLTIIVLILVILILYR
jgi:hypothetical protein